MVAGNQSTNLRNAGHFMTFDAKYRVAGASSDAQLLLSR
jgi:hypothetical protein